MGCNGLRPVDPVLHPDAPLLITETRSGKIRIATENEDGELKEVGWVTIKNYKGWTLSKYDWGQEVVPATK